MTRLSRAYKAFAILVTFTSLFILGVSMALAVNYPYRKSPYVNNYANVLTPQTVSALQTMLAEMHSRDDIERWGWRRWTFL